jgi:hypothetical protein
MGMMGHLDRWPIGFVCTTGRDRLALFGAIAPADWLCLTPASKVCESDFDPRFWANIKDQSG